jgi:hypothetical protein
MFWIKPEEISSMPLVSARVGQGKFRQYLIDMWQGCAATGFKDTRFFCGFSHQALEGSG